MNKIIGYFLLCVGLAVIFFATISMFKVFVDKQPAVQLLTAGTMSVSTQYGPIDVDNTLIVNVINLVLHAVMMMFLVGVGGKVAGTGVNMVKADTLAESLKKANISDVKKL